MTIKISLSKEAPTQNQILRTEGELGVKLPSEYVEFLARNNGGIPENNIFKISANNDSGINGFIPFDKIVYETKLIRDQISGELVPVVARIASIVSRPKLSSHDFCQIERSFPHSGHGILLPQPRLNHTVNQITIIATAL